MKWNERASEKSTPTKRNHQSPDLHVSASGKGKIQKVKCDLKRF